MHKEGDAVRAAYDLGILADLPIAAVAAPHDVEDEAAHVVIHTRRHEGGRSSLLVLQLVVVHAPAGRGGWKSGWVRGVGGDGGAGGQSKATWLAERT